jgi:hypothetical protein
LNEKIFKPLTQLKLERVLQYQLELKLPTKHVLWAAAEWHMNKGDAERQRMPQLIKGLDERIAEHNQKAKAFGSSSKEPIFQKFDAESKDLMRGLRERFGVQGELRLSDIEKSIRIIEKDVADIRNAFVSISEDIEYHRYEVKADCCPTVLSVLTSYWLPRF